jgi:sulfite exporter TauE/SafE
MQQTPATLRRSTLRNRTLLSTLIMAASAGLLSTLHCWGMCGGIVAALSLGAGNGQRLPAQTALALAYNLGRIISYGGMGAVAGVLVSTPGDGTPAYRALQSLGLVALVFAGLRLGGWLPRNGWVETQGLRVWRRLSPLTRRLLPIDRVSRALPAGMVWGFLPCGLVYAMLPVGAGTGSPLGGALTMLAFGAGTLPGMVVAGVLAKRFGGLGPGGTLRRYAGAALIALAVVWYALQWLGGDAHDHAAHAGHAAGAADAGHPPHAPEMDHAGMDHSGMDHGSMQHPERGHAPAARPTDTGPQNVRP